MAENETTPEAQLRAELEVAERIIGDLMPHIPAMVTSAAGAQALTDAYTFLHRRDDDPDRHEGELSFPFTDKPLPGGR